MNYTLEDRFSRITGFIANSQSPGEEVLEKHCLKVLVVSIAPIRTAAAHIPYTLEELDLLLNLFIDLNST